jgi:RHS repeat-associated protein
MVSKTENGQTTTYVYNYEDKMVQVNLPNGASVVYNYDHEGKRIGKTMNGTTIDYYFDGDDLITEAQGANILAYYTQGQGLLSQRRNNASYFYHYDGLGSTKALTDGNQNIQSSTIYDAWGNILQSSGTITNPYLYVGELGYYGDGDAGMYLLTQRCYNPLIGRFVVRGQLEVDESYFYCSNDPIGYTDPSGLKRKPAPPPSGDLKDSWKKCALEALDKYCKNVKGKKHKVDYKLIRCMIWAESSDNEKAKNGDAEGLMQVKTSRWGKKCKDILGHEYNPFNGCDSITCGIYLLCTYFGGDPAKYSTVTTAGSKFDACMKNWNPKPCSFPHK